MAARVMSCSWRPELESLEDPCVEVRGVKNFWKRFGVMGGGFLTLRLPAFATCGGGELGSSAMRAVHGEDDIIPNLTRTYRNNWREEDLACEEATDWQSGDGKRDEYNGAEGEVGRRTAPHALGRDCGLAR
jgi:hypothetical protein